MGFPQNRLRRLRETASVRKLVRQHRVHPHDLVAPLFVCEGSKVREAIASMPGQNRLSVDLLVEEAKELQALGIPAVLLFGLPSKKDSKGSGAWAKNGIVQRVLSELKKKVPGLLLMADTCLCEYSDHGHCGVVRKTRNGAVIDNDPSVQLIARTAVSQAAAGADWVAPSDMMDGRVAAIRRALDKEGYAEVAILSYAAKFSSAFYGPFRDAVNSKPAFGDRRSHQMDPPNASEAMREMQLDLDEGADALMIKPALSYLDIVAQAKRKFDVPIVAYNVSGEYSMAKAAAGRGWVNETLIRDEILTSIKRAGADMIITYHAKEFALDFQKRHGLDPE